MSSKFVQKNRIQDPFFVIRGAAVRLLILLIGCSALALAQTASQPTNSPLRIPATHVLGFEGTKSNTNGVLSIQDDALQFQKDQKPAVQIKIGSVVDVLTGEQSRQVGGTPMTVSKAATPFGGGRVVSLFAHKKYDTLTLEYVDANGGVHGAIFQLKKGQADVLRSGLLARGAHVGSVENEPAKQSTGEVVNESK